MGAPSGGSRGEDGDWTPRDWRVGGRGHPHAGWGPGCEGESGGAGMRERKRGPGSGDAPGSLTAEGAVPPGEDPAGAGTQGGVGLQRAAQGEGVTHAPTLAEHTTGEAGLRGHHPVALGEGSWWMKQGR